MNNVLTSNVPARTGQTASYAKGDDGDLKKGIAWPIPRFTDNSDGTVTDHLTGLIWLKNADFFGPKEFPEALNVCNGLADGQGGLSDGSSTGDWRLPNINEIMSLIDRGQYIPALPGDHLFENVQSELYYWSSTSNHGSTFIAWSIRAYNGNVSSKNYDQHSHFVWPVRGGLSLSPAPPSPVYRTGQTASYAKGDDGDLKKGIAWPIPRFTDNSDGTVTDHLTGLIWLKNADFFGPKEFPEALNVCNGLADGQGGLSDGSSTGDWRLPNINEIMSLIDRGQYIPALPGDHLFENVQSELYYWSSTSNHGSTFIAWSIRAYNGNVSSKNYDQHSHFVWPVRGGLSLSPAPPSPPVGFAVE